MIEHALKWVMGVVAIGAAIAALVRVIRDPRYSRNFVLTSLLATAAYFAHGIAGIVVLILLIPHSASSLGLAMAIVGWFGLGLLLIFRMAPGANEWQRRLGRMLVPEIACLAMVVIGLLLCADLI
jgi:hypothetical protein